MSLLDCAINWDAPASLKDIRLPTQGFAWVGDHVYDGNVGGAIRKFKTLSRAQQQRVEMLTDPGDRGYRGNNRELRYAEHTRFSV